MKQKKAKMSAGANAPIAHGKVRANKAANTQCVTELIDWQNPLADDATIADVKLSVAAKPGFTGEWIVYSGNGPDVNVGSSLGSLANVTNGQTTTVSGYNLVIDSEGYVEAPTGFTEASMSGIQVGFKYVAVPELSSTLLIGLASFGFILRRRK